MTCRHSPGSSNTCQASRGTPRKALSNRPASFFSSMPTDATSVALRMRISRIQPGLVRYLPVVFSFCPSSRQCRGKHGWWCKNCPQEHGRNRNRLAYTSPYASGSDWVESPMAIMLRPGSHDSILRIRSTLYSAVSRVRADKRPASVVQLEPRSSSVPAG